MKYYNEQMTKDLSSIIAKKIRSNVKEVNSVLFTHYKGYGINIMLDDNYDKDHKVWDNITDTLGECIAEYADSHEYVECNWEIKVKRDDSLLVSIECYENK